MDNVHTAGHSNRYFLNDPVPILDFRFCRERNSIVGVDDDGSVLMYDCFLVVIPSFGCDRPEKYQYAPMTQYFSHDYDPIQYYGDKFPLDPTTRQPLEMVPNGPLLDYLRAPYQFQQLTDPALSTSDCLKERREEVERNWARLKEVAQQERSMHDQTEAAMQQAENQELLDEIEEASDDGNAEDNDEFKIGLSEEEEEEEEENEMEEEEEEKAGVEKRRVVDSDSDVDIEELEAASSVASRSTRSTRASQPDVYARRYKPNKRREHANDAVGTSVCGDV